MASQAYSQPIFDLFSFARRGPGRRHRLSPGEIQQVARTVGRTPEVMVKVLPKSANNLSAARRHFNYIGRRGELDLETDDGERLRGSRVGKDLVEDWDLDLDEYRRKSDLTATRGREPARLVHKVIFSMPAGTPPGRVLTAVRNFAREEFALTHRYVMALHTDTPRPHVHVVIKAVSEQGQRLHIRKATLREWREGFARHLRAIGVSANATQRYVRGETAPRKTDGIYRASSRGESTHMRERLEAAAGALASRDPQIEPGKAKLVRTRREILGAWSSVSNALIREGHRELAGELKLFLDELPPVRTQKEWLIDNLVKQPQARRQTEPEPRR